MKIEFNTQEAGADEAKGIVALLVSLYGSVVLPSPQLEVRVGEVSMRGDEAAVIRQMASEPKATGSVIAEYEVSYVEEPDAAAAFGGILPGTGIRAPDDMDDAPRSPNPYDRTGVPRDSKGLVWDKRIHSGEDAATAGTNQDGSWKRRRNTPDATYDAVMAELRGAPRVPPVPAPVTAPPPPTTAPAPSPAPAVAAASSSAPGGEPTTFVDVMKEITKAQGAGKIKPEDVAAILTSIGAPTASVTSLMKDPSLIPAFYALFSEHVAGV